MLLGLKTTGYTRDFLPLTLRLQSLQLDVQIRSKVSLKGSGKRLRAAFSYYIHGPSTAADRSSPAFPTGRIPASLGWKGDPRPGHRSFLPPLSGAPLTFVRTVEGSVCPGLRAHSRGGPLPAMTQCFWCSCADRPPQAAEAPKGQPWPSVAAILYAVPRPPPPGDVLEGLAWASRWARWNPGGRAKAAAIEALQWRRKGRRRIAARPGHWLLRGFELLASAGR